MSDLSAQEKEWVAWLLEVNKAQKKYAWVPTMVVYISLLIWSPEHKKKYPNLFSFVSVKDKQIVPSSDERIGQALKELRENIGKAKSELQSIFPSLDLSEDDANK